MPSTTLTLPELPDHLGPAQRFELVAAAPNTMDIVCQRVIDGESLKQIAKAWAVPPLRFTAWVGDDRGRLLAYDGALKIRADELVHEAYQVAHDCGGQKDVPAAKLQVDTNLKIASKWDKERYGNVETHNINSRVAVLISVEDAACL